MLRVHMLEELNTPTRLPSPPRKLNGRGSSHGLWPMRLFSLPHLCIGVGMAGYLALLTLVAVFGTDIPATVTNAYTAQGYTAKGKKSGTVYYVAYRYSASGHDYTDSSAVAERTYAVVSRPGEIKKGAATVRVMSAWARCTIISWSKKLLRGSRSVLSGSSHYFGMVACP